MHTKAHRGIAHLYIYSTTSSLNNVQASVTYELCDLNHWPRKPKYAECTINKAKSMWLDWVFVFPDKQNILFCFHFIKCQMWKYNGTCFHLIIFLFLFLKNRAIFFCRWLQNQKYKKIAKVNELTLRLTVSNRYETWKTKKNGMGVTASLHHVRISIFIILSFYLSLSLYLSRPNGKRSNEHMSLSRREVCILHIL